MKLLNEPVLFSKENVKKIEDLKNAKYVCDTEQNGLHIAIFYGDDPHPDSGSRYFGLYYTGVENQLMIQMVLLLRNKISQVLWQRMVMLSIHVIAMIIVAVLMVLSLLMAVEHI